LEFPVDLPGFDSGFGALEMADIDQDGDLDLFACGRVIPGKWPSPATSLCFRNHRGSFQVDAALSEPFKNIGLVTACLFTDIDNDGDPDLVLACEWGSLRLFLNDKSHWTDATQSWGLQDLTGCWNGVSAGDFDGDGWMDLVASNVGLNDGFAIRNGVASELSIAHGDLDDDGRWDIVVGLREGGAGILRPVRSFKAISQALPFLKERFTSFAAYNESTMDQVLEGVRDRLQWVNARTFTSMLFINKRNHFDAKPLPKEAQYAPGFGVCVADFNNDGNEDVFMAQNFFHREPTEARLDGGLSLVLLGDGKGNLEALPATRSGIRVYGEGRGAALADYNRDGAIDLAVGQNGNATKLFRNLTRQPSLSIRLVGKDSNPEAIGASVRLAYPDKFGPRREIRCGGGSLSQDHVEQVLGMNGTPDAVEIRWPDGTTSTRKLEPGVRSVVVSQGP
jgi:enediyne biosynthesis protein E4